MVCEEIGDEQESSPDDSRQDIIQGKTQCGYAVFMTSGTDHFLLHKEAFIMTSSLVLGCPSRTDDSSSITRSSQQSNAHHQSEEVRDEVKEIQKMSRRETQFIRTWRIILLVMLVGTAAAVSSITYELLRNNETTAYKATVRPSRNKSVSS